MCVCQIDDDNTLPILNTFFCFFSIYISQVKYLTTTHDKIILRKQTSTYNSNKIQTETSVLFSDWLLSPVRQNFIFMSCFLFFHFFFGKTFLQEKLHLFHIHLAASPRLPPSSTTHPALCLMDAINMLVLNSTVQGWLEGRTLLAGGNLSVCVLV